MKKKSIHFSYFRCKLDLKKILIYDLVWMKSIPWWSRNVFWSELKTRDFKKRERALECTSVAFLFCKGFFADKHRYLHLKILCFFLNYKSASLILFYLWDFSLCLRLGFNTFLCIQVIKHFIYTRGVSTNLIYAFFN